MSTSTAEQQQVPVQPQQDTSVPQTAGLGAAIIDKKNSTANSKEGVCKGLGDIKAEVHWHKRKGKPGATFQFPGQQSGNVSEASTAKSTPLVTMKFNKKSPATDDLKNT